MIRPITMPKLGQSEESAAVVRWVKNEGDAVVKGDILFEIETDKAQLEVESYFEGVLLKILVFPGQTVAVHSVVGYIGNPGDPIPATVRPPEMEKAKDWAVGPSEVVEATVSKRPRRERGALPMPLREPSHSRIPQPERDVSLGFPGVSPRARRLAGEFGIDPSHVTATGPGGRVVERDVKAYIETAGYDRLRITPAAKQLALREKIALLWLRPTGKGEQIRVVDVETAIAERPKPLGRMRGIIAERLTRSFSTTPHFYVTTAVDMSDLVSHRALLKTQGSGLTVTDFVIKAVALSLSEFPQLNSTTDGKHSWWHARINVGMAVSIDSGLVVPVLQDADRLDLSQVHARAAELTSKARAGKLTPEEMTGGTFTISNMGMLDVENFTAIINPGESAILAVSSILKKPVVRDDTISIRSVMKMTLSADHRLVDGVLAARFLNAIRTKLEDIELWKNLT